MSLLTRRVEQKIADKLPERFAIIFDGWSCNQMHFVGVFATFPSTAECGYDPIFLGFSPFEIESSLNAEAHVSYISYELFDKSLSNVIAYVGDNCSTNFSIADKVTGGFVGCSSYRFNLALKDSIRL